MHQAATGVAHFQASRSHVVKNATPLLDVQKCSALRAFFTSRCLEVAGTSRSRLGEVAVEVTLETHGRGHIEELIGSLSRNGWQVAEES